MPKELTRAGFAESQTFAPARIARRVFGHCAAA